MSDQDEKQAALTPEVVDSPQKKKRVYKPGSRKGMGGRPSGDDALTKPITINLICYLINDGKSDREIARIVNIPKSTFDRWKKKHSELWDEHGPNSSDPVKDAIRALEKKVKGFWVERPIYDKQGNLKTTKYHYYPPDNSAIQYYLNNRDPANWKSKVEHNHALEELPVAINFVRASDSKKKKEVKAITDDYGNAVIIGDDENQGSSKS